MSEKEFEERLKALRKQYRTVAKTRKAAIQSRNSERVKEWLSETRKLDKLVEALRKQYWDEVLKTLLPSFSAFHVRL